MRIYFSLLTGALSLGIERLVFLALMELPPFSKGDSDIIWALPFFGMIVLGMVICGLVAALSVRQQGPRSLVIAGLVMNALSLAIPFLLLVLSVGRIFL
jgi:hypothetical protein